MKRGGILEGMTKIEIREGNELREKARAFLSGLVRFTEGDLSTLTKLFEEARGEVRVLRIATEARRYVETLAGNELESNAALAGVLSKFGEEVERRVRHEYEATDGPEGSRPWRCARMLGAVRVEREVLRAFIVDAAQARHESWTKYLLEKHPSILEPPLSLAAEEHVHAGAYAPKTALEEQVSVNADLVQMNRELRAEIAMLTEENALLHSGKKKPRGDAVDRMKQGDG